MQWEGERHGCKGEKDIIYPEEADSGAEMMDAYTKLDIIPSLLK